MLLRTAKNSDYRELAKVHLIAFDDFFLSSLGEKFLRTYYKAALESQNSIAVCAVDNDNIIRGFALGCLTSKGFHSSLVKSNIIPFLFRTMGIILTKPNSLRRIFLNLNKINSELDDGNYAELLSIGVNPSFKAAGLGKQLMNEFEKSVFNRGGNRIALTTDYYCNDAVLMFYRRLGYKEFYDFTTYPDRRMYKLIKDLN